jgi:hypothetical protein
MKTATGKPGQMQFLDLIRRMQPVTPRQLAGVLYPDQDMKIGIIMVAKRIRVAHKRKLVEFAGFGRPINNNGGPLPAMWRVVEVDPV